MENSDLKETVLTNIRSVTQSCKGGVPLTRLNKDYRDLLGSPIPFKELGYTSLESFIRDIPHVICLKDVRGQLFAEGVADRSTAHIVSLVSKQKQSRVPRPSRKPFRKNGSSRYKGSRNSNTNPRTSFQPSGNVKNSTVYHSKSSQPAYTASNSIPANFPVKAQAKKFDVPPRFQKLQQRREVENNQCSSPVGNYPPSRSSSRSSPEFFSSRISPEHFDSKQSPTEASSSQVFSDYDYLHPQRNPRPLRLKNDDRAEKLKYLENIENARDYIELYAEINNLTAVYNNLFMGQKKKNKGYTSVLKLGGKSYQSYPYLARTEVEAQDMAARKAVQSIQENKDYLTALPETPIANEEEVQTLIKNIEEIISEKPTGMFSHGIASEYESKFQESLPQGWIEKIKESPNFEVEQVEVSYGRVPDGVSWIIRPSKSYSSGSTTPSEVSLSQGITNVDNLETHNFEHPPLPKVHELIVPDGNEWGVYITYASSYIAARLIDHDEEFLNFLKSMYDFYGSQSLPVSEVYEHHLYALVRDDASDAGKVVQRVLVTSKLNEDMVECYFVDEGHYDEAKKSFLNDMHNDFCTFPYQAIHLTLDGLESYEPFMKSADLEVIQEKTLIAIVKRFRYTEGDMFPNVQGIQKRVYSVVLYDTSDEDNDLCLNDNFKQAALESWEWKLPKEGTLNKGYLTHIAENGEIYIRFLHPTCSLLEVELDKLTMDFEEPFLDSLSSSNEVCVARFFDGKWRRAVVAEQPGVSDQDMVSVFFVDYGRLRIVNKADICPLIPYSEFLATLSKQAIKCELHNALPSPKHQWTEAAKMMLLELAPSTEELIVRVVVEGSDTNLPKVNIHKRISSDPDSPIISINEKLSTQPHLFHGIEWLTTPDVIRSPDAFEVVSPSPLNPPEVPKEGDMFDVFVTIAATPHNFIVQPLNCAGAMNELRIEMQQFYSTEENLLEMDLSMLRKNCFYAALHPDGEWYRVRVVTITGNYDPILAAVYYVDFGDFGTVGIQNLQLLSQRFRKLPCQAIKASLAGIKPILGSDWNPVHCVKFKEMVTEKNFVSIVKSKCLRDEQDFCCLELEVILIDTSDPQKDLYINDLLVELSMARPV